MTHFQNKLLKNYTDLYTLKWRIVICLHMGVSPPVPSNGSGKKSCFVKTSLVSNYLSHHNSRICYL